MVAGYRTTAHDILTSIHAHGNVVTVHLKARHTDGTVRTYRISYTVQDGVITGARTKRLDEPRGLDPEASWQRIRPPWQRSRASPS